jgi:hypothetical protein
MEPVFCGESLLPDRAIALWNLSVKTQNKSQLEKDNNSRL